MRRGSNRARRRWAAAAAPLTSLPSARAAPRWTGRACGGYLAETNRPAPCERGRPARIRRSDRVPAEHLAAAVQRREAAAEGRQRDLGDLLRRPALLAVDGADR